MPIPFLLIGIGAAALGIGKSVKAGFDQSDANDTNERAQRIVDNAVEQANLYRKNSGEAVTSLGNTKIRVLDQSVQSFVESFEKLHNVDLTDSVGLDELNNFRIDKQGLKELKSMQTMASSIAGGVAGGTVLGAAAAFGAYGGAMMFGAASTGTAIASLSGVAATNATLAFLGGGSLAAGGLGIAGGTAVLGGLVAGPALAVMGFVVGAKASANRDDAYSNLAKAREYREEMQTVMTVCRGIRLRANMFERLLIRLNAVFEPLIYKLDEIILTSGTDFSCYTAEEKAVVAEGMSIAGAIKAALDTPILTEEGGLTEESEQMEESVQELLESRKPDYQSRPALLADM